MELERYHRQYLLKQITKEGQRKICAGRAVVIGCGALGSVIAGTLARAGVGFIRVIDRDFVELNNLQRQVLFDEEDIRLNLPKAAAAVRKLAKINSSIKTESIVADVNFTNIEGFIRDADVVLDGTDNFDTRFLMNDACVKLLKPWVYAACIESEGLVFTVLPKETPCLRCIFESAPPPELSPTCDTAGILAPTAMTAASYAATEAIKLLSGNRAAVSKVLYKFDVWTREAKSFRLPERGTDTPCICCGKEEYEFLKGEQGAMTTTLCGRNAVQIVRGVRCGVNLQELAKRLQKFGKPAVNDFLLRMETDGFRLHVFSDGRAIIDGTSDPAKAKSIYSKYIGL